MSYEHTVLVRKFVPANEEMLSSNVLQLIKAFVKITMEHLLDYKSNEYFYFVGGGFATYLAGRTTSFGDIDIYIILRKDINRRYIIQKQPFGNFLLDIIIIPMRTETGVSATRQVCEILSEYDMDICRNALVNNLTEIISVKMGDIEPSEPRKKKYDLRKNPSFDDSNAVWEQMIIRTILKADTFYSLDLPPCPVDHSYQLTRAMFRNVCKTAANMIIEHLE